MMQQHEKLRMLSYRGTPRPEDAKKYPTRYQNCQISQAILEPKSTLDSVEEPTLQPNATIKAPKETKKCILKRGLESESKHCPFPEPLQQQF